MTKKSWNANQTSSFERARDELFTHILRCDVLQAAEEHQREWFDDTMRYMQEEYHDLVDEQIAQLRLLGERYCKPVRPRANVEVEAVTVT